MHRTRSIYTKQSARPLACAREGVHCAVRNFDKVTTFNVDNLAIHKELKFSIKHIEALVFSGMMIRRCACPRSRLDFNNGASVPSLCGKSMKCQKITKKVINPRASFNHYGGSLYFSFNDFMMHISLYKTSVSQGENLAPRTNQKNRTRDALLSAARELMSVGSEVTLAKVAERAGTSRATVYRYFSDPSVLALDAKLDIEVIQTSELLRGLDDVRSRVHAIARYYLNFSRNHEAYFRQFLALSLKASLEEGSVKMRGARRVAAFAEALAPARPIMKCEEIEDLAKRLSMTTGMEQFIILEDILRVDETTGYKLQEGLVDALIDRYLPE